MKHVGLLVAVLMMLSACGSSDYVIISEEPVDGYYIYQKQYSSLFCRSFYEDIYYSGPVYNYGYRYKACDPQMTIFIRVGGDYLYLGEALDQGLVSLESLIPELDQLERHPEEISSTKAGYVWTDFHISGFVVQIYAGGECDQHMTETFVIDGSTYVFEASGCLREHLLYMEIAGEEIPVAELIADGTIDGTLLIPMLTPLSE